MRGGRRTDERAAIQAVRPGAGTERRSRRGDRRTEELGEAGIEPATDGV